MLDVVVLTVGPLLTLAEAKQHLRVDDDDSDTLIEAYADAAVLACMNYVDRQLVPRGAEPAFRVAAMLMLGDLYNFRETGQVGSVSSPINVTANAKALLDPYRIIRV